MLVINKIKRVFLPLFLLFFTLSLNASFIIKNDNVLPQKTVDKIDQMGKELKDNTGVGVYLAIYENSNKSDILKIEKNLSKDLKDPFVLLTVLLDSKKLDIINSKELDERFDKEQILSPMPWSGSILPLLTSHSKNPKAAVEAAMLNGYADIVEQIADSYSVKLKSAIGSQNKLVYEIVKLIFYGTLLLIFINFLYRKFKK